MSDRFPPQLPHGPITAALPRVYVVTGESRPSFQGREWCFSRTMTILIEESGGLTLVNTVRLDEDGLKALDALGPVRHIVRLGAFHGRDDAFYADRYRATLWALEGHVDEHGATIDHHLVAGGPTPLADGRLFVFETARVSEGLLLLEREGGVLVSCDALQNWEGPDAFFDDESAGAMAAMGFFRRANVGPGFLAGAEPKAEDFSRILALPFLHLISAHGTPLIGGAHEALTSTFAELFAIGR